MADDPSIRMVLPSQHDQRERLVAWVTTGVACLYCVWMGIYQWRATGAFGAMFEGLGSDLPTATRILITYRTWLYPGVFGGLVALLVAKELIVRDKRLSTMLTFLVTIAAQFVSQWMVTVYYRPLFDLIHKLS